MSAVLEFVGVSKWYGPVLGLRDVTLQVAQGITGLLGPNGAGKSTLLKCMTGEITPSRGEVRMFGRRVPDPEVFRRLGYAPEIEVFFEELTGREFVAHLAELSGFGRADADARAAKVMQRVGLETAMNRRVSTYSKGMRQRTKLAQAILHEPDVVLLDEPMTGLDPVGRAQMVALIQSLGAEGRTVVVSSHILDEVELMTREIVVLYQGQLLAQGDLHAIRGLIDRHPHHIALRTPKPRELAAALAREPFVAALRFEGDDQLMVETREPDRCYSAVPRLAKEHGVPLLALTSPDDNLAAVFRYLTLGARGGAA
ncbi:MAG: transporter related protein [Myxococcaceae bacterium]|nr:transporter related protein [Myxococcaceae bacterium]